MDVKAAPSSPTETAKRSTSSALGWTILLFAFLWIAFYGLFRTFPYLKNGSDVVFDAKLRWEEKGQIFPPIPP